jgi:hypothetical protein
LSTVERERAEEPVEGSRSAGGNDGQRPEQVVHRASDPTNLEEPSEEEKEEVLLDHIGSALVCAGPEGASVADEVVCEIIDRWPAEVLP